uniref:Uncharacterized protein n=1 Tax=Tetraselmis sp. GSL018 TaxID=582737 RepID=A0A061QLS7_9CHLO
MMTALTSRRSLRSPLGMLKVLSSWLGRSTLSGSSTPRGTRFAPMLSGSRTLQGTSWRASPTRQKFSWMTCLQVSIMDSLSYETDLLRWLP